MQRAISRYSFAAQVLSFSVLVFQVNTPATAAWYEAYPLRAGDYLSIEYINLLKQTRAPIQAGKSSDWRQHFSAEIRNNSLHFVMMGNFHESLGGFGINTKGEMIYQSFEKKFGGFKIVSRDQFRFVLDSTEINYKHVGAIKHFVNRHTVAGRYLDKQGRLHRFREEGTAEFPGHRFHYEVLVDYVMSSSDSFVEVLPNGEEGKRFGFKRTNNVLQLFALGGPMGDEPTRNPFLVLERVGD